MDRSIGRYLDDLLPIGHENPIIPDGFDLAYSGKTSEGRQDDSVFSDEKAG